MFGRRPPRDHPHGPDARDGPQIGLTGINRDRIDEGSPPDVRAPDGTWDRRGRKAGCSCRGPGPAAVVRRVAPRSRPPVGATATAPFDAGRLADVGPVSDPGPPENDRHEQTLANRAYSIHLCKIMSTYGGSPPRVSRPHGPGPPWAGDGRFAVVPLVLGCDHPIERGRSRREVWSVPAVDPGGISTP